MAINSQFYGRRYSVKVVTHRGEIIEINGDLRVTFRVHKQIVGFQDAEVTIYNLNADTETDILKNGQYLILEAGYENGAYGEIFQGYIRQPLRGKEDGVTYFLKLICVDGDQALFTGICNFTLSQGQTAQQIAQQVARQSTVPFDIQVSGDLSQQQTQRGKSFFGTSQQYLRSLGLNNNAAFYFHNNKAHISSLSQSPPAQVPSLNAQSGMIGIPTQVDYGVQVKCLINPGIVLDSWIKLDNASINQAQLALGQLQTILDLDGLYRVIGITATGDTRGNDWYFDLETISQTGFLPAMLANQQQSGM